MDNIIRTVYGSQLQTSLLLGTPLVVAPNSTLNEKFSIQSNVSISSADKPDLRYISVGNGGHRLVVGTNGVGIPEPIQHTPTDAALFNHLPFVLRELTNDLTPTERANYALRRIESHNTTQYIAYYLKRLNLINSVASMEFKSVLNGVTTTSNFIPNSSNLNPVPPQLSNTGVNVTTGDYVSSTAKVLFTLTESEILDLLQVANIIYGNEGYAIISEIAMCSGIDKVITVNAGVSNTFNFNEAIAVQVVSFINSFFALKFNNSGLDILLDVGATEPMSTFTVV